MGQCQSTGRIFESIRNRGLFTEEEWAIVLRGRNTNPKSKAKNADVITYRKATGLEAVFGWLYLMKKEERLLQLWQRIVALGDVK